MDLAGIAGAVGAEFGTAFLNQRFQKELQHGAQDFGAEQYAHRYQTQVADLKAAGLNPMLAYGQSPGSAPQVGAGGGAKADFVGAMNTTRLATAQEAKTLQDVKVGQQTEDNILWDTVNKKLQPALTQMQTMDTKQRRDYTAELTRKIQYEIDNLVEQRDEIISKVHRNNADANLKQAQVVVERTLAELNTAKQILTQAETSGQNIVNIIGTPKARAAMTVTGTGAAQAENVKKMIETVTDPVSDLFKSFRPLSRQAAYLKKAGE